MVSSNGREVVSGDASDTSQVVRRTRSVISGKRFAISGER